MKNKIISTTFVRGKSCRFLMPKKDGKHRIILELESKIPPMGYGSKQIIKMLKKTIIIKD
jgi:hypothetical protein